MIWWVEIENRLAAFIFLFEFSRRRLGQVGVEFDVTTEIVVAQRVNDIVVASQHDETNWRDMNRFDFAQLVVKWMRIFAKFGVERIERNLVHKNTLVLKQTLASIEKYGLAKLLARLPGKEP